MYLINVYFKTINKIQYGISINNLKWKSINNKMNKKYGCCYDDERIWKIEIAEGDNIVLFNNVCPKLIISESMQHGDYFNSNNYHHLEKYKFCSKIALFLKFKMHSILIFYISLIISPLWLFNYFALVNIKSRLVHYNMFHWVPFVVTFFLLKLNTY